MAGKVWRDAATLFLTAKAPVRKSFPSSCTSGELAAPSKCSSYFDYKVLMLKRSSKSKFMPKDFGYNDDDLEELVLKNVDRPMLMKAEIDESISRDIALRLAAIRETFKESGVLLIKSSNVSSNQSEALSFNDSSRLSSWRKQVHSNPEMLLSLYREVGAVPDLWALKEWSDWLTPTDLIAQGKRRFDTVFYTACLDSIPTTLLDQTEVTRVQWTDPASLLHQFYARHLWLAPPQVYELSRLLNFSDQQDLAQFSAIRHDKGLTTWLPVKMECEDGMLSILPGDSLYPDSPDYTGTSGMKTVPYPGTMEESRAASEQWNRLEFRDNYDCVTRVRGDSQHGHVSPVNYQQFQETQLNIEPKLGDCSFCTRNQRRFCHTQHSVQWRDSFTDLELVKKRGDKRLEERFMQKSRECPTFPV